MIEYIFKSKNRVKLDISHNQIHFELLKDGNYHKYVATYENINLLSLPKYVFDLLVYVLFYNLEELELEIEKIIELKNEIPLVSYSGGVDSTAVMSITGGKGIHINRMYDKNYENKQIKAVYYTESKQIYTDVELIRTQYGMTHGFNVSIGYISMMIPYMVFNDSKYIALGTSLDEIVFYPKICYDFENMRTTKLINKLKGYGINVIKPAIGLTEVSTTIIAENSGIKYYSSCHTLDEGQFCMKCFKCFRKFGHKGEKIYYNLATKNKLSMKNLPVPASTIYAIQKAGYNIEKKYKDIDVSFAERNNTEIMEFFNPEHIKIDFVDDWTDGDSTAFKNFIKFMS